MKTALSHQKCIFLLFFGIILIAVPLLTRAADSGPTGIVTCAVHIGAPGELVPGMLSPMTDICSICDLLKLLETGFNFIWIYLSIPLGAIMMLYGGFLMVLPSFTGSSNQATRGRKVLLNAFVGFAIVFFAWIGVDSILKIMGAQFGTGQIVKLGPWNKIECKAEPIKVIGGPVNVEPLSPELLCPSGITTKDELGFDVCDTGVKQAIQDRTSIMGARAGSCSVQSISPTLDAQITSAAQRHGIPPSRFRSLVLTESSANPNAKKCGKYGCACGITQVLTSTARQSCEWLQVAENGLEAGATEYQKLLARCSGNHDCAALGYNGGPAAIQTSTVCRGMLAGNCPQNSGWQESRDYVQKLNSCQAKLGG